jgi:hypothetical protein
MPRDSARALQLPLFIRDTVEYLEALARYEAIPNRARRSFTSVRTEDDRVGSV